MERIAKQYTQRTIKRKIFVQNLVVIKYVKYLYQKKKSNIINVEEKSSPNIKILEAKN